MAKFDRQKIEKGRQAVDAYRQAHAKLHSKPWHKGIPEEHTPLLIKMLTEIKPQGFKSFDEFCGASEELNIQELGFASRDDFWARVAELDKDAVRRDVYDEDTGDWNEVVEHTPEAQQLLDSFNRMWR